MIEILFKTDAKHENKQINKTNRQTNNQTIKYVFFQEKEKQKKLLQEQELRRSNRLTVKMREKLEQVM